MTSWDDACDLLAVGSGVGGVAAAMRCSALGGTALVIDAADVLGGVTARSQGQLWVPGSHLQERYGAPDRVEDALAYLSFLGAGHADPQLGRAFLRHGRASVEFLERCGVALEVVRGFPDYYFPGAPGSVGEGRYLEVADASLPSLGPLAVTMAVSPHGFGFVGTNDRMAFDRAGRAALVTERQVDGQRRAGLGLMVAMVRSAASLGVRLEVATTCCELVVEGGRVVGAVVVHDGVRRRVQARAGVVLAVGGYDWSAPHVRRFETPLPSPSMAPPTTLGQHLDLTAGLGAEVVVLPSAGSPRNLGIVCPDVEVDGKPAPFVVQTGHPRAIVVDGTGRRFGDESFYHDLDAALCAVDGKRQALRHWPAWLVFDAGHRERYDLGPYAPGVALPPGVAERASTIGELAGRIGVDATELQATVARFNRSCATGVDEDHGRGDLPWSRIVAGDPDVGPNPTLGPLDRAPFFAAPLHRIGTGIPSAGLRTDTDGAVLRRDGSRIAGLHAVGNAAARLETGLGYNSGIANARGLAFGVASADALIS